RSGRVLADALYAELAPSRTGQPAGGAVVESRGSDDSVGVQARGSDDSAGEEGRGSDDSAGVVRAVGGKRRRARGRRSA
ncbi:MAG TPA: hypothetical protein VFG72_16560, partial [Marmoricola sp.]|nr:hypothetical protein [Marmoricola sp.]